MSPATPGFRGRRPAGGDRSRLPAGQHLTPDFPVLTAGPTQHTALADWTFSIEGEVETPSSWTWGEIRQLPDAAIVKDIHCVTTWSKFDTRWRGVSVQSLLDRAGPRGSHVMAFLRRRLHDQSPARGRS